jgi:hypothetical protein
MGSLQKQFVVFWNSPYRETLRNNNVLKKGGIKKKNAGRSEGGSGI